ncbi:MAG: FAD-binding protein [Anaerolineales bacterium]|nr:FAD-binding protein [Anaerolineales bacterium]
MLPTSQYEVQEAVLQSSVPLRVRGGGSKSALSTSSSGEAVLELSSLNGVLEYVPEEFTFTARAGTQLSEIEDMLAQNGQWLPFDPPLGGRGATLGGALAAGLSGPGRYRFGGTRDFVLGVQWVSGTGDLLRGGGRVVKNASGFDFPKMMVGSLGRFGVVTEVTFKVFPVAQQFSTMVLECDSLNDALEAMTRLSSCPLDIFSIDIEPPATLLVRLAGEGRALSLRMRRLGELLGDGEILLGEQEEDLWVQLRDFSWLSPGECLIKVPITPAVIPTLEARLVGEKSQRRYSVGGNLAWIGWHGDVNEIDIILSESNLSGLRVLGSAGAAWVGAPASAMAFARRVKDVLDREGKFLPI